MPAFYGKREIPGRLFAYKVRPATNPAGPLRDRHPKPRGHRRRTGGGRVFRVDRGLKKALTAIFAYDQVLNKAMLETLLAVPGLKLYGIQDPARMQERVPTFSFRLKDLTPRTVAEKLAAEGIYVWDGNYYALNVTERLGVESSGGMVRAGATHYNTLAEVARLGEALRKIAG
jgi:selenocysteine lyase/cysteine desulfurase